jgi:hypothetical protein
LLTLLGAHPILHISRIRVKPRTDIAKAAFNKKKNLFTSKLDSTFRKKIIKSYIWSIVFMLLKVAHF